MKTVFAISWMDLRKLFKSVKLYMVIIIALFFLNDFTGSIRDMAEEMDVAVAPFLYPLFLGSWTYRLFMFLLIVIMMSDVPFSDDAQLYLYIRTEKREWLWGKILSIFLMSVIFQGVFLLLTVVVLLPDVGFHNEWGDVLNAVASMNGQMISAGNAGSMQDIVNNYTPVQALLTNLMLTVMVAFMIGLFIFLVNSITKSSAGMFLALIIGCVDLIVNTLKGIDVLTNIPLVMSWMDLSQISTGTYVEGKSDLTTVVFGILLICVIFIAILVEGMKKRAIIALDE